MGWWYRAVVIQRRNAVVLAGQLESHSFRRELLAQRLVHGRQCRAIA